MMKALVFLMLLVQFYLMLQLLMPLFLFILSLFKPKKINRHVVVQSLPPDYAIIVTAYQQTDQLPDVVNSILKLNYDNYLVYVVADNCDVTGMCFNSDRVVLLRPEKV